jgi:predicted Zn-dependent protease
MDRFDEAASAFRRSTELCPSHLVPRLNLAFAFLRAGRLDEGEDSLLAVLKQDPDEPVARARLEELRSARLGDKRGLGARS